MDPHRPLKQLAARVLGAACTAFLPSGWATDVPLPSPTAAPALEEVIVTARRRAEPLHEVPIAVTVLPMEELERRQLLELQALQYAAPNLVIVNDQTNRSSALVAMRGQFDPNSVPTIDPSVGIYLDGVYIARITGANLRLIDVERVEVLRGPQGTLFGRNTVGGAINIISAPASGQSEGYAEVVAGNYERRDLNAVVNLPIDGGRHAFRVVASHSEHGGYGRSSLTGRELNDDDTDYLRARLRLTPDDRWRLDLFADYTRFGNGGQLRTLQAASAAAGSVTSASGHPDDDLQRYVDPLASAVMANRTGSVTTTTSGASATVTFDGPDWTFKSITAARRLSGTARNSDQDGTPYDLGAVLSRVDEQRQVSQEFQVMGASSDGRFDWIGGALYFEERGRFDQTFLAYVPATTSWIENLPDGSVRNDSIAAYAELGVALSPRVRVTGGLRYTEDGRQLTSRNAQRVAGIEFCRLKLDVRDSPDRCRATLPERHFDYVPYMLGLSFRPLDRSLLYAKVSRGYRAGGYNLRGTTAVELGTFGPESVTSLEIGAKAELFDGRLRLDLAAFRSESEDIQLVLRERSGTGAPMQLYVENAGEARIDGGEFEFTTLLGWLQLSGSLGLLHGRYTELKPGVVEVTLRSEFPNAPAATAALAADIGVPTRLGTVDVHLDYSWRDDVSFVFEPRSLARQDAYGLWNARVRWPVAGTRFDVTLWGRNLTDERFLTRSLDAGNYLSGSPGDPRTYGLGLTWHYRRKP